MTQSIVRQPTASPGTAAARALRPRSGACSLAQRIHSACFFISTTLLLVNHAHLAAQQVSTVAPPPAAAADALPSAPAVPSAPAPQYPDAVLIPAREGEPISIQSDTESGTGSHYVADGSVVITKGDRTLQADHIEYDADSGDMALTGHVVVSGGDNDEHIEASHATFNIHAQTGRFYDVSGSVGLKPAKPGAAPRRVYANGNPFLFTGRMVVKTGPREYQIYDGTVTSCQLPRPDWVLSAAEFSLDQEKAHATNSVFRLMNFPVLWMPYVTHPVNADNRQTGILIPEIGFNSASKGTTIGEQVYWAIDRSSDITMGAIYYSARGYEETGSYRYHGLGQNFVRGHFSSLQDHGYTPSGGTYINQSGTDATISGRLDVGVDDYAPEQANPAPASAATRLVAEVEYLSSFPYREAFSSNFNQAVSTDVVSDIYATHAWNGMAASLEGDRYQGEKRVATTTPLQAEEQVHIFHAPAIEFTTTDHLLGATSIEWSLDSSVAALKRSQPTFTTSGMVERLDLHPEVAYPFGAGGWRIRPSVGGRETFYSRSRFAAVPGVAGPPEENTATLNRSDFELELDLRAPVLERTFDSGWVRRLLRHDVKHTIEPDLTYRYTTGISNFPNVLRFDAVDVASDTNELEYGITQRLFLRRPPGTPCRAAGASADATEILGSAGTDADADADPGEATGYADAAEPQCGNREWMSWRVEQKYFFDPNFGGAVVGNGPRSVLGSTLDLTGIAFLTGPRTISPLTSRLRVRTSERTDVEWDFDVDTCSAPVTISSLTSSPPCRAKFTADNIYVDVHQGSIFAGASYARLNAPARSYVDGALSAVADFNQMRLLFGFGNPARPGLSAAAYSGIDLDLGTVQYGAIQTSYNWNCCGVSVEYRKYELGTARNDNGYKFNFTLANIGSAGNLRHSDQVF